MAALSHLLVSRPEAAVSDDGLAGRQSHLLKVPDQKCSAAPFRLVLSISQKCAIMGAPLTAGFDCSTACRSQRG